MHAADSFESCFWCWRPFQEASNTSYEDVFSSNGSAGSNGHTLYIPSCPFFGIDYLGLGQSSVIPPPLFHHKVAHGLDLLCWLRYGLPNTRVPLCCHRRCEAMCVTMVSTHSSQVTPLRLVFHDFECLGLVAV